jgi:glycosyltransferase involved in cell wall biosynthesis
VTQASARIAFIAPRYGEQVVGGAETLCRLMAENLTAHGTRVDVLTTCAVDHFTWVNELPEGDSLEAGVRVRRFPVGPRDAAEFGVWHTAIALGATLAYGEQVRWMANSAWSPDLIRASEEYDWLVAMPYLFGTTFWSAVADPDKTVIVPCLHDEPHAKQAVVLDSLTAVRGLMLNAPGEERLADRLFAGHRGGVRPRHRPVIVGAGFDETPLPAKPSVDAFCARYAVDPGFLLYAGRREAAKGVRTMFEHYRLYRESVPDPLPLALMGSGDEAPPADIRHHVIDLGFVPLHERAAAYAAASLLIQPSRLESFGMVVFEAWLAGTPVLVNADSEVLRDHCADSAGGLWFTDGPTFAEAIAMVQESPDMRDRLACAGREYTLSRFRWDAVRSRFLSALEAWA